MDSSLTPSPDAASTEPASPFYPAPQPEPAPPRKRVGSFEGHCPDEIDTLETLDVDSIEMQTRRLRHDGWTPERMRLFLQRFAECGLLREACNASGMSARSYYNLLDRDPLFAAGVEAARVKARDRLADENFARALNGGIERIYRDGMVVAERHRHDNRLAVAVLARLDTRIDRAEQRGDPHLRIAARWEDYLDALGEGRRTDGLALLADPADAPPADLQIDARERELLELHQGEVEENAPPERDFHRVWEDEVGEWWTDYPPPPGFDGDENGRWGTEDYERQLSPDEQAVVDADCAAEDAKARAAAAAQRDAFFGFAPEPLDLETGDEAAGEELCQLPAVETSCCTIRSIPDEDARNPDGRRERGPGDVPGSRPADEHRQADPRAGPPEQPGAGQCQSAWDRAVQRE
jgi:hypothetical protein